MESVELRHAPFMLWIHDLSVMDPYFVLPLMMGAIHVVYAEAQSTATRSHASQNHAVDAYRLHLFLPVVPGRPGAVLGLLTTCCRWPSSM